MAQKWIKSKFPGVRYYEHAERKLKGGIQKDKYFSIMYRVNGKQKEEAIGWASNGWTLQKANEILCELKENIRLGKHPQTLAEMRKLNEQAQKTQEQEKLETESDRITLQEVFEKYAPIHRMETTGRTAQVAEQYYRKWIEPVLGGMKMIDITPDHIQSIISKVLEARTTRTADYIKTVIRQIFNFAKKRDLYFKDNPAAKIKFKKEDNKRSRFLDQDEARILLDELAKRSPDTHDMTLLSLYAGLRAGEILNLRWENVLWNTDRIAIVDAKNGENRIEPMHPIIKENLKKRFENDCDGYVFKSRSGGKLSAVSDTFQRTVDGLGFNDGVTDRRQKVVFHTLRHTYASWLVMNGVDLYTTQKLMGHKCHQMTQRYAHLAPGYLEKAVNTLKSI